MTVSAEKQQHGGSGGFSPWTKAGSGCVRLKINTQGQLGTATARPTQISEQKRCQKRRRVRTTAKKQLKLQIGE